MKINLLFVKWHTGLIWVSTWLMVLVWKNVNGHKILSEIDPLSIKRTPNLSVGLTDNTLQLTNSRNPTANYKSLKYDSIVAKNTSEKSLNMVVSSRHINKNKNYQNKNKFNFIRKHTRLKKSVTENVSKDNDVKPKISTLNLTTNLTDVQLAHYRELYFKLSMKKQMEFDAQIAYFCMFFIIIVICFASWFAGICRIRKHSVMEVLDFENSQPLTTVKDVMLRKSRYLPMFENFYNKKKMKVSRGTNP
ncbi:hypothetical protein LOTGIDRAFT_228437 [Lottia gigantea]|uniref:Uncharacterized protein n=1 Tax=Lottia gigantea TaxID=225164 RepID=V4ALE1_LOTGI|nr:hypothetical protein LOTGIDRAFT_228437 [Lottia gigantea]ESO97922.1 hypothetical protein LOTGIDRAFT_228437 [Lottia gigantea]